MTTTPPTLVPCPGNSRFYLTESPPNGGGWFGYYLLNEPDGIQYPHELFSLLSEAAWKDMPGHLVFAPQQPEHLAAFVKRLDKDLPNVKPQTPGAAPLLVWGPDSGAQSQHLAYVETTWGGSNDQQTELKLAADLSRTQVKGDFQWTLPAATTLTLKAKETTFSISFPGNQGPMVSVPDATTAGQTVAYKRLEADGGRLALSGAKTGMIQTGLEAGKDDIAKLQIGLRFFVRHWQGIDVHKFNLIDASSPAMPATLQCRLHWFPSAPYDPQRSFLQLPESKTLPTTYTLVEGDALSLSTTAGSRLGFVSYLASRQDFLTYRHWGTKHSGYLTPAGDFTIKGVGSKRHLLAGLKGTEGLVVSDGENVEFVPGEPAVTVIRKDGKPSTLKQGGTFGPLQPDYYNRQNSNQPIPCTTSWLKITSGKSPAQYGNQPEKAPLYGDQGDKVLHFHRSLFQPAAGAVPVIPYAGTVDWTVKSSPADLERQVVSQARRNALIAKDSTHDHTGAGPTVQYTTTPQGIRVGLNATGEEAKWCEIVLAQSLDAPTPEDAHTVRWTGLSDEIWRLLSHNEVFAVLSTAGVSAAGKPSQEFVDKTTRPDKTYRMLDLSGWFFDLSVEKDPAKVAADAAPTIVIFKFAHGKLSDLAGQPHSWADANLFNGSDAEVTGIAQRIQAIIEQARNVPAEIKPLYQHLISVVDNPRWTGLVAFNADIGKAPTIIESILEGLPGSGAFYARHVVIPISKAHNTDLKKADSAIFALVDYEGIEHAKLDLLTDTTGQQAGRDEGRFDFGVPYLRAQFENSQLRHFECEVALGIHKLFGVPVKLTQGGGDPHEKNPDTKKALKPFIVLKGSYQTPSGADAKTEAGTFSFQYRGDSLLSVQGRDVLQTISITKVNMKGVSASISRDEESSHSVARFGIAGALTFSTPLGAQLVNAFDYQPLPFTELGVLKTVGVTHRKSQHPTVSVGWQVDTARTAFDTSKATIVDGLAQDLPLRLKSFLSDEKGFSLKDHGYHPVQLPLTGKEDKIRYGFLYQLDLGRPGSLVTEAKPLTGFLITGWNPAKDQAVGIRIEGLSSDLTLALEGVLHLHIGSFALKKLGPSQNITSLILRECRLGLLGKNFPPAPLSFEMVLQGVKKQDGVIWAGQFKPVKKS